MFVSMMFPVFLGMVVTLFFLLPKKGRPVWLLFASYACCGWMDLRSLAVLVIFSFCIWAVGMHVEDAVGAGHKKAAKVCAVVTICVCVLLLSKCLPDSIAMSVGLSFYVFQGIGYIMDIYQGKSHAERNFVYVGCYFAFFPKLVSGPIERGQAFLPQIKRLEQVTLRDRGRLSTALAYLLWGYFMKMVVADRLAAVVNPIFAAPTSFDSFWLLLGALFYTVQIYCDFAGYSYIAIGCAKIFGIELTQNFKAPYFACGIADFWRRWHISLGAWLRDYLYIPLGGGRKGLARKCVNTMIIFLVCGAWHGRGANFIVWGLLHGFYSVVEACGKKKGWGALSFCSVTFLEVAFAWIFFRASSLGDAFFYIGRMFTAGFCPKTWMQARMGLQLSAMEILLIVTGICTVWAVDWFCTKRQIQMPVFIQQKQNVVRYLFFYLLMVFIFIFGVYGPGYSAEQFIYMRF